MLKHLFPPHADNAYHGHKLALWLFALLVLYGHGAFAATGINPGTLAEFQVEIPRELRLVAGRGQLSPIKHAHVAVAAPASFDPAREFPVMVISATSDPNHNSSRRLLAAYADAANKAGWLLVAVDPVESVPVEKDDVALRVALNTAALAVLELKWPLAHKAPLAFGGFSGGAKFSGWLAAAFASQGRVVAGMYLAGINTEAIVSAARHFKVMNEDFKHIPVFLQYGDTDPVATGADHWNIRDALIREGFKYVRIERFRGTHEVAAAPLSKALEWFAEVGPGQVPRTDSRPDKGR